MRNLTRSGGRLNKTHIITAVVAATLFLLPGCARTGQTALACSIKPVDADLAKIARRACGGSARAYIRLAKAYEHGALVERNEQLAIELYRAVSMSMTIPKTTYIYVPGAGKVAGYTMPVQAGMQTVPGNAEAQYRLAMMLGEGRGQARDVPLALHYLKTASAQGHAEAAARLTEGALFGKASEPIN